MWSLPGLRLAGIEIRLHIGFLLLAAFIFSAALERGGGGAFQGLVLFGVFLVAVLVHEAAHIVVAHRRGIAPRAVVLLPIGGVPLRDEGETQAPPELADEVMVALAGPAASLAMALLAALLLIIFYPQTDFWARPLITPLYPGKSAVWVNLFLAGLNLLPAYPLDGGRVLRAYLAGESGPERPAAYADATRRVVTMGQALATLLIFAGIMNMWMMLLGVFLFVAVQIEDRSLLFQSVIERVRLEEVMLTDFSTLSPADTLEDALEKAVHSLQDDFPVIRGGDMVGVISKQNIVSALREQGNGYVQSAMKRVFEIGRRGDSLAGAFGKITRQGSTIIPIVEQERLVGIVTLQNLMHSMGLLAESRKLKRE